MRASDFEFKNRFWIIAVIFWASFWLYFLDKQNAGAALSRWIGRWNGWTIDSNFHVVMGIATVIAFCAVGIRVWATSYLHKDVMSDFKLHSDRLVADGPYRHVRNPLYIGTILIGVAMAPLASRLGAVSLVTLLFVFTLRLIGREEAELKAAQGESYARFLAMVPKLVPTLKAQGEPSGAKPQWGQAIVGEGFIITFALAVLVMAVTENLKAFWGCIVAGFAVAIVTHWRWGPKEEKKS